MTHRQGHPPESSAGLPQFEQSHNSWIDRPQLTRRQASWGLLGLAVALAGGCSDDFAGTAPVNSDSLTVPLALSETPLDLPIYPLASGVASDEQLQQVMRTARPPLSNIRFPVAVVYHALRLWGREAAFSELEFPLVEVRGRWGATMFDILTDERAFQRYSAHRFKSMFVPSEFGLMVRSTSDAGHGSEFTSTHPGKYIQVMADLRVPVTQRITLADQAEATSESSSDAPRSYTIADVIHDEARRVCGGTEIEWLTAGLSRYLTVARWKNRFRQTVSFDELGRELANRQFGEGSCYGGHVPYALASLLAAHRQRPLLSSAGARTVEQRLRDYTDRLSARQLSDGSWDHRWADSSPRTTMYMSYSLGNPLVDIVTMTGHHLEWMTICEPSLRPKAEVLERAAAFLSRNIVEMDPIIEADWHAFGPLSHAAKAVLAAHGVSDPAKVGRVAA